MQSKSTKQSDGLFEAVRRALVEVFVPEIRGLKEEVSELRTGLRTEIGELRTELRTEIATVNGKLDILINMMKPALAVTEKVSRLEGQVEYLMKRVG